MPHNSHGWDSLGLASELYPTPARQAGCLPHNSHGWDSPGLADDLSPTPDLAPDSCTAHYRSCTAKTSEQCASKRTLADAQVTPPIAPLGAPGLWYLGTALACYSPQCYRKLGGCAPGSVGQQGRGPTYHRGEAMRGRFLFRRVAKVRSPGAVPLAFLILLFGALGTAWGQADSVFGYWEGALTFRDADMAIRLHVQPSGQAPESLSLTREGGGPDLPRRRPPPGAKTGPRFGGELAVVPNRARSIGNNS